MLYKMYTFLHVCMCAYKMYTNISVYTHILLDIIMSEQVSKGVGGVTRSLRRLGH